jgi:hypothetical protein
MRTFYRWLTRDYLPLFPQVPERTRLARLFKTHTAWTARYLAAPTVLGVADTYGIEVIHPVDGVGGQGPGVFCHTSGPCARAFWALRRRKRLGTQTGRLDFQKQT